MRPAGIVPPGETDAHVMDALKATAMFTARETVVMAVRLMRDTLKDVRAVRDALKAMPSEPHRRASMRNTRA